MSSWIVWALLLGYLIPAVIVSRSFRVMARNLRTLPRIDERAAQWARANGFAAPTGGSSADAGFPGPLERRASVPIPVFHVMAGRRAGMTIRIEQFRSVAFGGPRDGDAGIAASIIFFEYLHSVSTELSERLPYTLIGPRSLIRAKFDLPGSIERVPGANLGIGRRSTIRSADPRFAERVCARARVAELESLPLFRQSVLMIRGDRCHVVAFGPLDVDALAPRVELLTALRRAVPDA